MNYFSVFILAIFISLNSFWLLGKTNILAFKELEKNSEDFIQRREFDEQEYKKEKEKEINFNQNFSVSFQPIRKEGNSDLVLPEAHASIIMDVDTGTILHYNDGKEHRQIASLTKLMTATLVMEKVKNLKEVVTITEESTVIPGTIIGCPNTGYCIGQTLEVGEKISVESLLMAMLMNSANDAATALAIHVSGSVEEFVDLMNKRAKELRLKDSNFCTPSGLEPYGREKECYSTAYDVARIGAHALQYEKIWEIMRMPAQEISSVDGKYVHHIMNTDQIVDELPNCIGGKTGFTPLAGKSLFMAAHDGTEKHRIVAVLLDDPYRWRDMKNMINWAFKAHIWQ